MKNQRIVLCLFAVLSWAPLARSGSKLYYHGAKNGMDLVGPYLTYNFLSPPYSFGLSQFTKDDIMLEMKSDEQGQSYIQARWPRYLLDSGKVRLFDLASKNIDGFSFDRDDISVAENRRFFTFRIPTSSEKLRPQLKKGIHFCISQREGDYEIEICSDKLKQVQNTLKPLRSSKDVAVVVTPCFRKVDGSRNFLLTHRN